jgi:hypothetical protein
MDENNIAGSYVPSTTYRLSLAPEEAAEVSESFFAEFCSFQSLKDKIAR